MKFVQTINYLQMGGAEALLLLEAEELIRRGHSVEVIALEPGNEKMEKRYLDRGIYFRILKKPRYRSLFEYLVIVKNIKPDVIHTHLYPAMLYGAIAKVLGFTERLIHTEHNTTNNRRKWYLWPLDFLLYIPSNFVICISEGVRKATVRWNPSLARRKAMVIDNAISPSKRLPLNYIKNSPFKLVTVGRLVEDKNIALQIDLLARIEGLTLDIIGDGHLLIELKRLAEYLGVSNRVRFLGVLADLKDVYSQYDAYIHTATLEGFGLVVAESMSAGLPVIVPVIPGVSEVAGNAGLFFQSNNIEDLERVVRKLLVQNEDSLKQQHEISVAQSKKFLIEEHVDKLLEAYTKAA
ncbi:MAG TPA: hypothetical protein DHV59_12200 [Oxalobacteraceae bacterium]|nr:hypothetical protein [Oxalobacteraceae bacterium]